MININDYYISKVDLSVLKKFIIQNGIVKNYNKKEYMIRQNDKSDSIGFIVEGMFKYIRVDSSGKEHIVGYSFTNEFVGDYVSCLCHNNSLVNIQAIIKSTVYLIKYKNLEQFLNYSTENQYLGRVVAEQLFVMTYKRLIESYCCTPEERYLNLMHRYPSLKEIVPLKEIASFIGVSPETVSNIRKKLLKKTNNTL